MEIIRRSATAPKKPLYEIEPEEYDMKPVKGRVAIFDTETDPFKEGRIVRPFTCNMIRSLHKITPQLRSASPHHYINAPKQRSISTAWSSHSGSKLRKSNFNKPNTTNIVTPDSHF